MQNTVRAIILIFLAALILLNYNSIKLLSASLNSLVDNIDQRTVLVAKVVSDELSEQIGSMDQDQQKRLLRSQMLTHSINGVLLYDSAFHSELSLGDGIPGDVLQKLREPSALLTEQKSQRWQNYLVIPSSYTEKASQNKKYFVLLFNVEKLDQIERSTKIISYSNFILIGVTGLLVLYFLESMLKPYRVLMQTARSAQNEIPTGESRNDADFLIAAFKGVIAKLKEKEQELARLHLAEKTRADNVQQLNQDLIRSISSGLMIMDLSGKITVFNEAAQAILQVPRLTVLNEPYQSVIPGISRDFTQDLDECFAQKTPISRAELEIHTQEGNRFLGANIMPLKDREQRFAGVFCLFTDITEFKLLQKHMALKEKFAGLGEMAAGVAHEFRNSAATISGYLQLLESKIEPQQKNYVAAMQKELQALQGVVNDFLSFARPVKLEVSRIPLEDLLKDTLEEVRVSPAFSSVSFSLSAHFPTISGDEGMLRQVFTNLIRNAAESLDGTGRKGIVEIRSSGSSGGRTINIEIRDNGVGIPQEDLNRIFTPFFSTKRKGVGLGLAIVQKLVLQHNGLITAESSPQGSLFRVQLPAEGAVQADTETEIETRRKDY